MAYSYKRTITIASGKVPSTETDFPVLVSGTYAYLATVPNGGRVQHASGHDVAFFSDSGLTTQLKHEIEKWTNTGEVIYWVKVPSISTGTVIYMGYGDSSISTTQADPTNVWDSNYKAVMHLKDNAATTTVLDSTTNGNNFTSQANTSTMTTTGKIGSGLAFTAASSHYLSKASITPNGTARTISFWVETNNQASNKGLATTGNTPTTGSPNWYIASCQNAQGDVPFLSGGAYLTGNTATPLFPQGTWAYIVLTYDGTTAHRGILNGVVDGTRTAADAGNENNTNYFGVGFAGYFDGTMEEIRISTGIARSTNWALAEFNNQNDPASFYTIGSEEDNGGAAFFPLMSMIDD